MLKQKINIDGYWKVVVYYNVNHYFFHIIQQELWKAGASHKIIAAISRKMLRRESKAVTYSNLNKRLSVVVFNQHNSFLDYLSSLVHEAEHVKQAMLYTYYVEDEGEPPAYTIGYLVMKMWGGFIAAIRQS